jgi:surface antigen
MKRTIVFLSSIVLALVFFASTSQAQQSPETMSKQQLNTLIATAKTPADQQRISRYYHFKALEYQAEVQEHEKMIANYKTNPVLSNDKFRTATIGHCTYLVATFNKLAETSQQLAAAHQWMADDIPANLPAKGK